MNLYSHLLMQIAFHVHFIICTTVNDAVETICTQPHFSNTLYSATLHVANTLHSTTLELTFYTLSHTTANTLYWTTLQLTLCTLQLLTYSKRTLKPSHDFESSNSLERREHREGFLFPAQDFCEEMEHFPLNISDLIFLLPFLFIRQLIILCRRSWRINALVFILMWSLQSWIELSDDNSFFIIKLPSWSVRFLIRSYAVTLRYAICGGNLGVQVIRGNFIQCAHLLNRK